MSTLQDFLTSAVVASGAETFDLRPTLKALDAYLANFEHGAQANALRAASQALSSIKLEGAVRKRLECESEHRIAGAPPMSL